MYGENLKYLDRPMLGQFLLMGYQHILNTYADSSADPDETVHNVFPFVHLPINVHCG